MGDLPLPEPMTDRGCDLRGLPYMPLDVVRLIDSDFAVLSTGEEFKAGVLLWCKAWNQVPAASLPDDDRILSRLVGLQPSQWRRVRDMALRGWIRCSDGRLYHPTVAEKARQAWSERQEHRAARENEADRKRKEREERKRIFAELKTLGVHLPWNVSLSDLRLRHREALEAGDLSAGQVEDSPRTCPAPVTAKKGEGRESEGTIREDSVVSAEPKATEHELGEPTERSGQPGRRKLNEVQKAFDAWNTLAERLDLPTARKLDEGRRKAIGTRLADGGLDTWMQALAGVERSRHCRGENDRGWKADLDFVCQPTKWRRLLEGFYGVDAPVASTTPPAVWTGPAELRTAVVGLKGLDWCAGYFDRCSWHDLPERTLTAPSRFVASRIRDEIGGLLDKSAIRLTSPSSA